MDALKTVLDYDGHTIAVRVGRSTDREWIEDFLGPAFAVSEAGAVDVEIELAVDPVRFAALERQGPAPGGGLLDGLALDASMERFERWSVDGREPRTAFDRHFEVFYEVSPGPVVRITAHSGNRCRMALMRVVREYAMVSCLRRGDLFLHAAALAVDGRGIVIAGGKSSGKTTSLTWALQLLAAARFVSNDRVLLRPHGEGFEARGMPTLMMVRAASLELLPELLAALRAERGTHLLSRSELRGEEDLPPLAPWSDGRTGVPPRRYAELLGRACAASAPAQAIVFPEVVGDDHGLDATRLDPVAAAARLERTIFGLGLARRSELFDLPAAGPHPDEAELRARTRRLAAAVPAYVWQVGRRAPQAREALAAFLREVAGA